MDACGGGVTPSPSEGASNPQPVLRHAGVVSDQSLFSAGERLAGGDRGRGEAYDRDPF